MLLAGLGLASKDDVFAIVVYEFFLVDNLIG